MDIRAPVLNLDTLAERVRRWQASNKTVCLCHGRFDPLHVGHILHFEDARSLGDILVVTITADLYAHTKPGRPFLAEDLRAISVASQRSVSGVAISSAPCASPVLEHLRPDLYIKGRDYECSSHPGYLEEVECARALGIRVLTTTSIKFSSTDILHKMMTTHSETQVSS